MLPERIKNNTKTKILFTYEKDRGGETIAIENVIKELRKYSDIKSDSIYYPNQTKYGLLKNFIYVLKNFLLFLHKTRGRPYNWIVTPTYLSILYIKILNVIRFNKINAAWYYHGDRLLFSTIKHNQNFCRKISQTIVKFLTYYLHIIASKNTDLLIIPSNYTKNYFIKTFCKIKGEYLIAYNGVDLDKFYPLKIISVIKKKLNINPNFKIISYVGRINSKKGLVDLIHAFNSLVKKRRFINLYLVIAFNRINFDDDLKYFKQIEKLIHNTNLETKVKLLENYSNINEIYNISDLVILPSKEENFPLVIPEAFASGTIIIASKVGGVNEILEQIDKRLLILNSEPNELSEKIKYFLNLSNTKRNLIINKGQSLVFRSYTWKVTASMILNYLKLNRFER